MRLWCAKLAIYALRRIEIASADWAIAIKARVKPALDADREKRIAAMWKRAGR